MAAEFPDRKQQLVFLINNYDMMLGVITVRPSIIMCLYYNIMCRNELLKSPRNQEVSKVYFKIELKNMLKRFAGVRVMLYIHCVQVLSPYFGGIVTFVKDTEVYLESEGQRGSIRVDERKLCAYV